MRKLLIAAIAVLALGGVLAACGDDDDSSSSDTTTTEADDSSTTTEAPADTTAPAGDATVIATSVDAETALVDAGGYTLYLFTNDTGTTSACTGSCADTWPALTVEGDATAGDGADQALLEVVDGHVVYNGHPLYTFSGDAAPGDANGQGVGGVWYMVSPAGDAIM
jgi:predicted lipoprotein with Yx(FWY)xxD motif